MSQYDLNERGTYDPTQSGYVLLTGRSYWSVLEALRVGLHAQSPHLSPSCSGRSTHLPQSMQDGKDVSGELGPLGH
jgi:hypothetical protein